MDGAECNKRLEACTAVLHCPTAESLFHLLKREGIRCQTYLDREEALSDVFSYIEMFDNAQRHPGHANDVSPLKFENQCFSRLQSL